MYLDQLNQYSHQDQLQSIIHVCSFFLVMLVYTAQILMKYGHKKLNKFKLDMQNT